MTNPDNDIKMSTMPSPLFNLLTIVFNVILFLGLYLAGNYYSGLQSLFIWVIFPILSYALTFGMNVWNQSSNCNSTNIKLSALGALPMIGTIYISLIIGAISFCRIPIVSVLAPAFSNNHSSINSSTSSANKTIQNNISNIKARIKKCCSSDVTLEQIEANSPLIKGLAIAFYIIFGVMFGNVFSFSISATC